MALRSVVWEHERLEPKEPRLLPGRSQRGNHSCGLHPGMGSSSPTHPPSEVSQPRAEILRPGGVFCATSRGRHTSQFLVRNRKSLNPQS